jgi:DNA-binding HxlR family transcriptional regulator
MIMTKNEIKESLNSRCPVRNVLSRIGNKWSMLIFFTLNGNGTMRFNELQRKIPDISQKMLTTTLRTLEADGLIYRKVYPEVPPKVEYSLTERGKSLIPIINNLLLWAKKNMNGIIEERKQHITK